MTKIAYDTEFLEDGKTIELISIGLVSDTGREYYAVASDCPWDRIKEHDWLVRNVVPSLPIVGKTALDAYCASPSNLHPRPPLNMLDLDRKDTRVKPRWVIANEVRDFILHDAPGVELWADYAAYDHVVLCQLWGTMMQLPNGIPMWTHDLQQKMEQHGLTDQDFEPQPGAEHHALSDAKYVLERLTVITDFHAAIR